MSGHNVISGEISFDSFCQKALKAEAIKEVSPWSHVFDVKNLKYDLDRGIIYFYNGAYRSVFIERDINPKIKKTTTGFLFYRRTWEYVEDSDAEEETGMDGFCYKPMKTTGEPFLSPVECVLLVCGK